MLCCCLLSSSLTSCSRDHVEQVFVTQESSGQLEISYVKPDQREITMHVDAICREVALQRLTTSCMIDCNVSETTVRKFFKYAILASSLYASHLTRAVYGIRRHYSGRGYYGIADAMGRRARGENRTIKFYQRVLIGIKRHVDSTEWMEPEPYSRIAHESPVNIVTRTQSVTKHS